MFSGNAGVFGNPIRTRGANYVPHITTGPPRFSDDAASLLSSYNEALIEDWGPPTLPPTNTSTVTFNEVWGNRELPEVPENQLGSIDPFVGNLEAEPRIRFLPSKNVQKVRKY